MSGSELLVNVLFYAFAALAVAGSVMVAASRNIVRSAFSLLAVLFAAAALYALMKADFIAAAQVLIYVGGILVLIIFAVMLTHRITDVHVSNESSSGLAASCACACLFLSLVAVIFTAGDRFQTGALEVPAKSGDLPLRLLQYHADGRTGLQPGGDTGEGRVVLAVKLDRPAASVDFEVSKAPDFKDAKLKSAAVVDGLARAEFDKLDEAPWHWRAALRPGTAGWARQGEKADFHVQKGITKPAARALIGPYLLAFEVASMLLLAALVGAAFLARKEVKE